VPRSLAEHVSDRAGRAPTRPAYVSAGGSLDWRGYDAGSSRLAGELIALGLARGECVAVCLPDGPDVHVALLACEKAGLLALGIGPRAGLQEIEHLLRLAGARALVSRSEHQGVRMADFTAELRRRGAGRAVLDHHLVMEGDRASPGSAAGRPDLEAELARRRFGPGEVFLLNSTSGTTGMPKCVAHDQLRWLAFHELAMRHAALCEDDVFMSVVPAPFGFGLWTSHVTPTLLGVPTVVMPRFDAGSALALAAEHRVTVLAAVSTQLVMMLGSSALDEQDLRHLRVVFTGGEAVPYEHAARFEDRTGARVLQFYGSNETGAVSGTRLEDPRERRLRSSGRPIPEMQVRLFDEAGREVGPPGRGQPGCKGPTLSRGYYAVDGSAAGANAALLRPDGWMLLGDIVEIDADGWLRVIGRCDDFIIRGGKNVSAAAVEEQVSTHPSVVVAAAVAMPDPVFGERVCVYVELREGARLELAELVAHLASRRVSRESFPERLVVLDALPRGSGGKLAKQALRDDIRRRLAAEARAT